LCKAQFPGPFGPGVGREPPPASGHGRPSKPPLRRSLAEKSFTHLTGQGLKKTGTMLYIQFFQKSCFAIKNSFTFLLILYNTMIYIKVLVKQITLLYKKVR
jgi:hypothetical protein